MIDTVTGSMASRKSIGPPGSAALRGARGETNGVTALEVPDDLAGKRRLAAGRATQLADDPLLKACVDVDLLAGQRGAPAVRAAISSRLQCAEAATQQNALEQLHMSCGRRHDVLEFVALAPAPAVTRSFPRDTWAARVTTGFSRRLRG